MYEFHTYECEYCGTRFDNEEDCHTHEVAHQLEEVKDEYRAFDESGEQIELNTSNLEDVYFLEVSSTRALDLLIDAFNDYSMSANPLENSMVENLPVMLYWNDTAYEWVDFTKELEEVRKVAEVFGMVI